MYEITVTSHNIHEMQGYITKTGRKVYYYACTRMWYYSDNKKSLDIWSTYRIQFT